MPELTKTDITKASSPQAVYAEADKRYGKMVRKLTDSELLDEYNSVPSKHKKILLDAHRSAFGDVRDVSGDSSRPRAPGPTMASKVASAIWDETPPKNAPKGWQAVKSGAKAALKGAPGMAMRALSNPAVAIGMQALESGRGLDESMGISDFVSGTGRFRDPNYGRDLPGGVEARDGAYPTATPVDKAQSLMAQDYQQRLGMNPRQASWLASKTGTQKGALDVFEEVAQQRRAELAASTAPPPRQPRTESIDVQNIVGRLQKLVDAGYDIGDL